MLRSTLLRPMKLLSGMMYSFLLDQCFALDRTTRKEKEDRKSVSGLEGAMFRFHLSCLVCGQPMNRAFYTVTALKRCRLPYRTAVTHGV